MSGKNGSVTTLENGQASPSKNSNVPAADAPAERLAPVQAGGADFSGQRAVVNIAASQEDGGKNAVFVGAQGVGFLIPRGKNCNVPVEVANALRDANVTSYQRDENDKNWERVESPRFSFIAQDQPLPEAADAAA